MVLPQRFRLMLLGAASGLAMSAAHANDTIVSSSGINTTIATPTTTSRTITQTGQPGARARLRSRQAKATKTPTRDSARPYQVMA